MGILGYGDIRTLEYQDMKILGYGDIRTLEYQDIGMSWCDLRANERPRKN